MNISPMDLYFFVGRCVFISSVCIPEWKYRSHRNSMSYCFPNAPFYIPAVYILIYILNPDFHNPNLQQVCWNANGLSTVKCRNMVDGIIK